MLKTTLKKIMSQKSFSQKFLRNYFLVFATAFLKKLHRFFAVLFFFKHVRDVSRTQSSIKMEPIAKIVNGFRDVFKKKRNI